MGKRRNRDRSLTTHREKRAHTPEPWYRGWRRETRAQGRKRRAGSRHAMAHAAFALPAALYCI